MATCERLSQQLLGLWRTLTRPLDRIHDQQRQEEARRLASVIVWSMVAALTVAFLGAFVMDQIVFDLRPLLVIALALVGVFGMVLLRWVRLARWVYLALMHSGLYVMWLQNIDQPAVVTLGFVPLLVLIAGAVLPLFTMVLIAVVNQSVLFGLYLALPSLPYMGVAAFMNGAFSTAICVITLARQREQRQLQESERRYRQLLEINFEPLVITDMKRRIVSANPAFEALIGFSLAELRGRLVETLTTPESQALIERVWNTPEAHLVRVRAVSAEGTEIPVEVRTKPQQYDGQPVLVMAVRDLSRETAFERERREYELRYRALFEYSNDGIFIVDLDGRCLTANQRGLDMLGLTLQAYSRRSVSELIQDGEKSQQIVQRLRRGEITAPHTGLLRHQNGHTIPVEITPTLVRDSLGRPLYLQSVVRDISERLRSEQERLALVVQRERTRMLRQLIDDFSHHVRTPLANIKNSAYLLGRLTDPERRQRHQRVIDDEVMRLVTLLDDLLMLTRLEQEAEIGPFMPIDLNEALTDLLPQPIGLGTADPEHEWRFDPADLPAIVFGDRTRLQGALRRILDNARQYTPAGGRIRVETRVWEDASVACVRVVDTGIGIAPDELPRIFDTFYRSDKASERQPLSTGLGLSICRKVVELHRGLVTVTSAPNVGTTVTVWLPMDLQLVINDETLKLIDPSIASG